MKKDNYQVHEVEWTEEKIKNFWDFASHSPSLSKRYFTDEVGDALLAFVESRVKITGLVLDYGSGSGHLLEKLITKKINCKGADYSEESLKSLDRFKENEYFKGSILLQEMKIPLDDESVDFIFFVETIEHMLDYQIDAILKEFNRVLKRGGKVFITMPNRENLNKYKHQCPDCGARYHYMQHINKHSKESLTQLLEKYNFITIECDSTIFLKRTLWFHIKKVAKFFYRKRIYKNPHLYYLGKKR